MNQSVLSVLFGLLGFDDLGGGDTLSASLDDLASLALLGRSLEVLVFALALGGGSFLAALLCRSLEVLVLVNAIAMGGGSLLAALLRGALGVGRGKSAVWK